MQQNQLPHDATSTNLWHAGNLLISLWNPNYTNIMQCVNWEEVNFMAKLQVWSGLGIFQELMSLLAETFLKRNNTLTWLSKTK